MNIDLRQFEGNKNLVYLMSLGREEVQQGVRPGNKYGSRDMYGTRTKMGMGWTNVIIISIYS